MNDLILYNGGKPEIKKDLLQIILETEDKLQELSKIRDEYRKAILMAMEEHNLTDLNDEIAGVYIHYNEAKTNLETFDKERLRDEDPDTYDKYTNFDGKRSANITIRRKK